MGKWRVPAVVHDLIEQTEQQEIEPAEIGRKLGVRHSTDPNAERQSFYDVRDGTKRIWLHDAEEWAERLGGRLTVNFDDDPWAQLESAINALPQGQSSLKRSLRALMREHRPHEAAPPSKRRRAAASSE